MDERKDVALKNTSFDHYLASFDLQLSFFLLYRIETSRQLFFQFRHVVQFPLDVLPNSLFQVANFAGIELHAIATRIRNNCKLQHA